MPRNTYADPTSGHTFNRAGLSQVNGLPAQVNDFSDTDFPSSVLADVYLMAAECALRGAGDRETGRAYANAVRERAGVSAWNSVEFNLNNLIDERARELYWEKCAPHRPHPFRSLHRQAPTAPGMEKQYTFRQQHSRLHEALPHTLRHHGHLRLRFPAEPRLLTVDPLFSQSILNISSDHTRQ